MIADENAKLLVLLSVATIICSVMCFLVAGAFNDLLWAAVGGFFAGIALCSLLLFLTDS